MPSVPDPMAWKEETFLHFWNYLDLYALPFCVISDVMTSTGLWMKFVAPLWPHVEWFSNMLSLLWLNLWYFRVCGTFLVHPHTRKFHSLGHHMASCVEVIQRFVENPSFSVWVAKKLQLMADLPPKYTRESGWSFMTEHFVRQSICPTDNWILYMS